MNKPDPRQKHPDYSVYAVLPRPNDMLDQPRPNYWAPIGAGWKNKDESITVRLELMPLVPGVAIQLRPYKASDERKAVPGTEES